MPAASLKGVASSEGACERLLVRELQVSSYGKPEGNPGNPGTGILQHLDEVQGGRLPFNRGIGGKDDFPDAATGHSLYEAGNSKVVRPHSIDGRDGAHQHVVQAPMLMNRFDREDVASFLDDADRRCVALRIGADGARIDIRVVPAHAARMDGLAELDEVAYRARKPAMPVWIGAVMAPSPAGLTTSCGLRGHAGVASCFQLQRKLWAAGADDPAAGQDVHTVRHDVIEQSLIVGDHQR